MLEVYIYTNIYIYKRKEQTWPAAEIGLPAFQLSRARCMLFHEAAARCEALAAATTPFPHKSVVMANTTAAPSGPS